MKFRKTAEVEASQWFKMGDHPAVVPVPYEHPTNLHAIKPNEWGWCPTLEGGHLVEPGDWILTGVHGEHWPCKPDIFAATYEPSVLPVREAPPSEDFCPTCGELESRHFSPCNLAPDVDGVLRLLVRLVKEGKQPAARRVLARQMQPHSDDGQRVVQSPVREAPQEGQLPSIDPRVHHVGVSNLRLFTTERLRTMTDVFVFQDGDEPLSVLMPYRTFQALQAELSGSPTTGIEPPEENFIMKITLNGQTVLVGEPGGVLPTIAGHVSYEDIVEWAAYGPGRILSVTYSTRRAGDEQRQGSLSPGKSTPIEDGMTFNVADTSNA